MSEQILFIHAADGPVQAADETQALQPSVKVRDVEPLYRSNGRQGRRKGKLLWRVYAEWVAAMTDPGESDASMPTGGAEPAEASSQGASAGGSPGVPR